MHRLNAAGPLELTLYATAACDAECSFCKREQVGVEGSGTMRPEFVRQVLKRFPTVKGVCIAGFGETLLVPWLGKIVAECRRAGAFVGLITNGSRLRECAPEIAAWDLGPHGYVSVSLNATTAEEHQAVFRFKRPCWANVLEGARELVRRGVNAGASFVVTRETIDRMPRMVALVRELGLRFGHLHNVLPHGSPRDPWFLANVLREGDREVEAAIAAARELPGAERCTFPALLPPRGQPSPAACMSPFTSIGVDARGCITGCRRVFEPSPRFGRITEPDVWNNEHYRRYRAELSSGKPNETCAACFGSVRG